MLRLAALDALSALLFGAVYGAGALRWLSQGAFLVALGFLFVGLTALWVRTERLAGHARRPPARAGRALLALAAVLAGFPALVLMPLFAVQTELPPEAGADRVISGAMVLLLASTLLVALMNVAGACVIVGWTLFGRGGGRRR